MAEWRQLTGDRIILNIKALPGASRSALAGIREGRLRVKVAAAPENGRANTELIAFLAKTLGCAKGDIVLQSGEKSRLKSAALPAVLWDKLEKIPKE
ncbi:MAG: DUF167 domain-containing protein [Treponema sp.]|jgi:uncharacterized protein (TIGR00251 family)|nr:DUF167 domain-containing protein [Treponema sp.]